MFSFGTIGIRHVIKSRCPMFLQYILKQEKKTLLYKFFETQSNYPQKGDWYLDIIQYINYVGLNLSFEEISNMSEYSYKANEKRAVNLCAFNLLITEEDKNFQKSVKLITVN